MLISSASAPAASTVRAKSVHSELLKQLMLAMTGMVQSFLVCSINEIYSFNA
jgi:hypothetical protein